MKPLHKWNLKALARWTAMTNLGAILSALCIVGLGTAYALAAPWGQSMPAPWMLAFALAGMALALCFGAHLFFWFATLREARNLSIPSLTVTCSTIRGRLGVVVLTNRIRNSTVGEITQLPKVEVDRLPLRAREIVRVRLLAADCSATSIQPGD